MSGVSPCGGLERTPERARTFYLKLSSSSDIDGHFGPQTVSATKAWQTAYIGASSADGSAGKQTFTKAGTWLRDSDGNGSVDTYLGAAHNVSMTRDSDGNYHFTDGSGNGRIGGYDYLSCT